MILRNQVEWALHCAGLMAGLPEGKYISTKALAEFHGVPKEYLSKALQALSQAGLVDSTLGPSGGYRLAREASAISFLDIVEAIEGKGPNFACSNIRANNPCRPKGHCDRGPCQIARVMWKADAAWRQSLAGYRLSDLTRHLEEELSEDQKRRNADWILQKIG